LASVSDTPDAIEADSPAPATLAAAARERRDIVSGLTMDEARLIRFVEGPDGVIVPDLGRKLPGRGVWVAAERAAIDRARKQGLFARALKRKVGVADDLCDQIVALSMRRLLSSLGLARKAGDLVIGFEKTQGAILANRAAFVIEALDGAADGRRKLADARRRAAASARPIGLFTSNELGLALGAENVVHLAFLAGRGAERWSIEVDRLAGFRPLCPEGWDF
jgi:predicted RNA-binding protein YlxR (DUF448 family)/ribosomal protein L7Ae-like RNA K-turn-binding protein